MVDLNRKALIAKLLAEGKISKHQAIILGREPQPEQMPTIRPVLPLPRPFRPTLPYMPQYPVPFQTFPNMSEGWPNKSDYAESCPCNPKNGGSGMCNCIMGGPTITC